jgi:hypothetical protein
VVRLLGTNFNDPMIIDVLQSGVVVGNAFYFDAEFDLESNLCFVGMPALDDGFYDMQVTTPGGTSPLLVNAVEYRLFAEEMKVQRVRIGFSSPWAAGGRLLSSNVAGS